MCFGSLLHICRNGLKKNVSVSRCHFYPSAARFPVASISSSCCGWTLPVRCHTRADIRQPFLSHLPLWPRLSITHLGETGSPFVATEAWLWLWAEATSALSYCSYNHGVYYCIAALLGESNTYLQHPSWLGMTSKLHFAHRRWWKDSSQLFKFN